MKKLFPCGHAGKGKYCHRCEQKLTAAKLATKHIAPVYAAGSAEGVLPGSESAPKATKAKAQEVARQIREGTSVSFFKGQRLRHDRSIISIPIGYSWRLVCLDTEGGVEVKGLFTHEEYNKRFGGGGR